MRVRPDSTSSGVHFLRDSTVIGRLVASAGLGAGDLVVEFGAGPGVITAALAGTGARVLAVERDEEFVRRLRRRFEHRQVRVVHADLRRIPLPHRRFAVVANLPFAVTTVTLRRLLGGPDPVPSSRDHRPRNHEPRRNEQGRNETGHNEPGRRGTRRDEPGRHGTRRAPGYWSEPPLTGADLLVEWGLARRLTQPVPRDVETAWWAARYEMRIDRRVPASAFSPPPRVAAAHLVIRPRAGDRHAQRTLRALLTAAYRRPDASVGAVLGTVVPRGRADRLARSTGISPPTPAGALTPAEWLAVATALAGTGEVRTRA